MLWHTHTLIHMYIHVWWWWRITMSDRVLTNLPLRAVDPTSSRRHLPQSTSRKLPIWFTPQNTSTTDKDIPRQPTAGTFNLYRYLCSYQFWPYIFKKSNASIPLTYAKYCVPDVHTLAFAHIHMIYVHARYMYTHVCVCASVCVWVCLCIYLTRTYTYAFPFIPCREYDLIGRPTSKKGKRLKKESQLWWLKTAKNVFSLGFVPSKQLYLFHYFNPSLMWQYTL